MFGGLTARDGAVYVCADEAVHAVHAATGERQWLTPIDVGSLHGPPAVDGETLIARIGGVEPGLVALERATGEVRWRATGDRQPSVPRLSDGTVVVGLERPHSAAYDTETVYAFDATTGERTPLFRTVGHGAPDVAVTTERIVVCERVTNPPDRPATTGTPTHAQTPTVGGDDPTPAPTPRPEPTRVYGLDQTGDELWSTVARESGLEANRWESSTPAVVNRSAYVVLDGGPVVALDATTGDQQWRVDASRLGTDVVGLAVVDGAIFAGGDDGVLAIA